MGLKFFVVNILINIAVEKTLTLFHSRKSCGGGNVHIAVEGRAHNHNNNSD